jgi:V/A-type H+-transporting ATPase subunit K
LFASAQVALLFIGVQEVMAEPALAEAGKEISVGMGLALIGIGIPTALSTIAAGIAVGPIGAASLAVLAEKPEIFGRTLIYLGLAEGIAIYGLVMSILLLDKI